MKERLPDGEIFKRATKLLKEAQEFTLESRIGVGEANFKPKAEYPNLPVCFLLATDMHYGSIHTNYDLLEEHLDMVENTPNTYLVTNGDDVDAFVAMGKVATGTYENPLPPQLQTLAYIDRIKQLDKKGKLGAMSFGNHNEFMFVSGYEWLETFASTLDAPIFTSGGLLHIKHGDQTYNMAINHKYWGTSKLNPTNACKRFIEYEYADHKIDIAFLGHTHQSEMLQYNRGDHETLAVIGGTYKVEDTWAQKQGIGRRGGRPGMAVLLYPDEHRMVGFKDIEVANQFMIAKMFEEEVLGQTSKKKQENYGANAGFAGGLTGYGRNR